MVGSACALELARANLRVTVIDPGGSEGQGWRAAAGLLSPQVEAREEDPLLDLGVAGREYYRSHQQELEAAGGTVGLTLDGVLRLAATEDESEQLKDAVAWQRQHGLYCEWLGEDEVREQWPWLGASFGALLAPNDGSLDPVRLVNALTAVAAQLGVQRLVDRIRRLEVADGRVTGAVGDVRHQAPRVVLAAGSWSGRLEGLPRPVSVEPVRGQMLAVVRPQGLTDFTAFGHGHYVLTRGDEVLIGATVEHVGFDAGVTRAGLDAIAAAAARICPALAGLPPVRTWAGLRPGTPDGLPIIGREPRVEGLWYATGHGRNGILLAGVTAAIIEQQMRGEPTIEAVHAFRPERFWDR